MFSKRDYKRKRKEEQEAAAHVFQDFIDTFQNTTASIANKTFVRSGILYRDTEEHSENVKQIYKPKPLLIQNKDNDANSAMECAKILKDGALDKPKKAEKPKSNLDLLKEELKLRHSERGERDRLREEYDLTPINNIENDETTSTNLFVANLNSKITENHLMLEFGAYGPLASVKILWPRGDETHRNSNCGFVAFMSRKDAERALKENQHRDDMRICWGKTVEIPSYPIYIPNSLLKLYLPPPLSGLPFNAQAPMGKIEPNNSENDFEDFDEFLSKCFIKVTIPLNKKVLTLVHRMVEFVVREGPMFEAFIMNKEINNLDYNFLFDCHSPTHVYYRWKIFSILHGDCQKTWSMAKFRMFKGGSIWCPPVAPCYTAGMPNELICPEVNKKKLSDAQANRLISLIRTMTMDRSKIAETMLFCLNHNNAIDDSIEIILDSIMHIGTLATKRIARLYLISDVLTNCKSRRINIKLEETEATLTEVFKFLRNCSEEFNCHTDKDQFNLRVVRVMRHWDIYKIFSERFIESINTLFCAAKLKDDDDNSSLDEPLDGANLLKRSMGGGVGPNVVTGENLNVKKVKELSQKDINKYFVPSKWDTVDPEEVEAQAMSTERMYIMELEKEVKKSKDSKRKKRKSR